MKELLSPGVCRDEHFGAIRQVRLKPKQRGTFESTGGLKPLK